MSRPRIVLVGVLSVLLITSGAFAATIVGTAGADVLRGTAGDDRLFGKRGNDVLYGRQGDDILTGGAGKDRFVCGGGYDVANAELGERVAADCEDVRREPRSSPTPPAPPPSPSPPPPPPPAAAALPGVYCGYTGQGPGICVTASADGRAISEFSTSALVDCSDGSRWTFGLRFSGRNVQLAPDLTFSFDYSGPINSSSSRLSDIKSSYTIRGTMTATGQVSGTVAISTVSFVEDGTRYSCTQTPVSWTANRQ